MSKYGSNSVGPILVGGYNLVNHTTDIPAMGAESVMEQSDTMGDAWQESTPVGLRKGAFGIRGFYDDDAETINESLLGTQGTPKVVCVLADGNTVGQSFRGMAGACGYKLSRVPVRGALHKVNADFTVTGEVEDGVVLQPYEAETADGNGTAHDSGLQGEAIDITASSEADPTEISTDDPHLLLTGDYVLIAGHTGSTPDINGVHAVTVTGASTFTIAVEVTVAGTGGTVQRANTRDGGAGYQQIGAYTGITGYVGKVQHSADNTTWADLVTFANVTAARNAQRIAASGVVRRYTRYVVDVTGSGSLTVFGGFSRA